MKWYSASRHYGFISRNDDGGDLFVHRSVISAYSKRFPSLRTGEEVEFSVVETNQGIEATYVTGPGGQPVKVRLKVFRSRVLCGNSVFKSSKTSQNSCLSFIHDTPETFILIQLAFDTL